jgi:hypothetical protein
VISIDEVQGQLPSVLIPLAVSGLAHSSSASCEDEHLASKRSERLRKLEDLSNQVNEVALDHSVFATGYGA